MKGTNISDFEASWGDREGGSEALLLVNTLKQVTGTNEREDKIMNSCLFLRFFRS